jgi:hypothetical protein
MKKFAAVLLTLALMVVLVDASSLCAVIESESGGVAAFMVESPQSSLGSFLIESEQGGIGSFAVEGPQTSVGAFMIENGPGGVGQSSLEVVDGLSIMRLYYSQYYFLTH